MNSPSDKRPDELSDSAKPDRDHIPDPDATHVDDPGAPFGDTDPREAWDAAFTDDDRTMAAEPVGESAEATAPPTIMDELDQWRGRAMRVQAELENYRKRVQREMEDERRYACLPLMRDLLAVVDNLSRAIEAAEQHENSAGLLEGVQLVAEQLAGVLQRHHCAPIPAEGERFDPHRHEAIAQYPSDEHEPGHVSLVTQVGYQLHDRVIRPAQVIVAAPRPES
jgi:molecular chaperone GrpE